MLISRRLIVGGLGLLGAGLARRSYAQAASTEFHVGYQKAGLLSVAKEQGVFERRLKPLGVDALKWSEFELGPPIMDAISEGTLDFSWVGDVPAVAAQSAGAKFVYAACMPASEHGMLVPERSATLSRGDQGQEGSLRPRHQRARRPTEIAGQADLAYGDIVRVFLSPRDTSAALSRGDVDVWVIHDPYFALAERVQKACAIATTQDIVNGNSVYVVNSEFATKYPKALAVVIDEVVKVTTWAAQNRSKFAEATSAAIGTDLEAVRIAIGRSDLVAGPRHARDCCSAAGDRRRLPEGRFYSQADRGPDAVWSPPAG